MVKLLLLFSLHVLSETSFLRDEYDDEGTAGTRIKHLRSIKRYPRDLPKIWYGQHKEYNRYNDERSKYKDDDIRKELVIRPYIDLYSQTYHRQQHVEKFIDKADDSVVKDRSNEEIYFHMPNIRPKKPDIILCYGYMLPTKDIYLKKFTPLADKRFVHHMALYGCEESYIKKDPWVCPSMKNYCKAGTRDTFIYAWTKNAPSFEMPKNVRVHVGGRSGIHYIILQVHYLDVSPFLEGGTDISGVKVTLSYLRPRYFSGFYRLIDEDEKHSIPAHKKKVHIDMACSYREDGDSYSKKLPNLYPLGFGVHTHELGTVVSGYRVRDGQWKLIGKMDPQKPQTLYEVFNDVEIRDGDKVFVRCTYDSTSRSSTTHIGLTHHDEMCRYYIMYRYDANSYHPSELPCGYIDVDSNNFAFPEDSDTPLIPIKMKPVHRT